MVISQKGKFGDDILLRESRALFSQVTSDGVWNTFAMHEIFALPTARLVPLHFERRRARNVKLLVQARRLTSLCLCHQIRFHVRWTASESKCSDDPSRRHDLSHHPSRDFSNNIFESLFSSYVDEPLGSGPESPMFARTTEIDSLERSSPSRRVSAEPAGRDQGTPCQDAQTPISEQSGMLGGGLAWI